MKKTANDEAIRDLLGKLGGVQGAQLERGDDGEIVEIHILADDSRAPKQIVRDVLSALAAKFSLKIDHKIISVAQLLSSSRVEASRLRYLGMEASYIGSDCRFKVRLTDGKKEFAGAAEGGAARLARYRALARATAAALNEYLAGRGSVSSEDIKLAELQGDDAVISEVVFHSPDGDEVLVGSCLERDDGGLSAVRATLDSVNRLISRM